MVGRVKGIIGDGGELKEGKMAVPYLSAADLCVPCTGQAIVTEKRKTEKKYFFRRKRVHSACMWNSPFSHLLFSPFFQTKLERVMFFLLPYVNQYYFNVRLVALVHQTRQPSHNFFVAEHG